MIHSEAFARAGLLGNPSDGFGGKTISIIVKNFSARIALTPDRTVSISPGPEDLPVYSSVFDLLRQVNERGYYGGTRLLKAAIKCFVRFCAEHGQAASRLERGFSISYQTNIPRSVGLAGSSAIVVAALKALRDFYELDISPAILASLALSVEKDELGIPAGLQDRVVQSYGNTVYMDFSQPSKTCGFLVGNYQPVHHELPENLYLAYGDRAGEPTETLHGSLAKRFEQGDKQVRSAMQEFAELTESGLRAIEAKDTSTLHRLLNANFDLRQKICDLNPFHVTMIETARSAGCSAKYCGSGGAIIGLFPDQAALQKLKTALAAIDCTVLLPTTS